MKYFLLNTETFQDYGKYSYFTVFYIQLRPIRLWYFYLPLLHDREHYRHEKPNPLG